VIVAVSFFYAEMFMATKRCPASRKISFTDYRQIIEKHLPRVLTKCSEYTNRKHIAEIIAIYTFAAAYHLIRRDGLMERLDDPEQITAILDSMLCIVGKDFVDPSRESQADKNTTSAGSDDRQLKGITGTVMDYLSQGDTMFPCHPKHKTILT
jgi:hypothetical protein